MLIFLGAAVAGCDPGRISDAKMRRVLIILNNV
jgi:hypothetical protein